MPRATLPELVASAVQRGLDPQTPSVAVERATRGDERVIAATIAALPARLEAAAPTGPVVVMIGRVFADYLKQTACKNPPRTPVASENPAPRVAQA
jgi:siroheme synthase